MRVNLRYAGSDMEHYKSAPRVAETQRGFSCIDGRLDT
ncbi:hypothetical protein ACPOL_6480 [Acidisarcina polymorpha]|uniref:Uncharacterized protein n=1 Tax=Acidisarcina polymorpha TaxID=2211140 RepID=A0A2Z5GAS1_9BACT|nr:hypothetical protein ACPOL_6480 [Acidisarcina polymorpha]